jgi:NADPH2:quinone reductase
VASYRGLPIEDENSLVDVAVPVPDPRPHDVVAAVRAVSANPADVKRRVTLTPGDTPTLLGYDAAGVVQAIGPEISTLAVGDEVWYSGDITRQGTNAACAGDTSPLTCQPRPNCRRPGFLRKHR